MAVVGSLLTLGALQTHAAATNEVHGLTIALTAQVQGSTTTNGNVVVTTVTKTRLMNKDILNLLAGLTVSYTDASNNVVVVSNVAFTSKAALVLKASKGSGGPQIFVRDFIGTTKVDYVVSNYLGLETSDISVRSQRLNTATGSKTATDSQILTLTLDNQNGTSFSASGLLTVISASINDKAVGLVTVAKAANASLAGTGTVSNSNAVVSGTLVAGSAKVEVQ